MKPGDYIQWECGGVYVFKHPRRIKDISECEEFVFVEGSSTGIPIAQAILVCDFKLPIQEEFTFFWHGPFSQWYPSNFVVDGIKYCTAEQYMMAGKARFFGDIDSLKKIMATNSPRDQKKLGRGVQGFNEGEWNKVAKLVVYKGNYAKFTQNKDLLAKLLETGGTTLCEASPYDKIWGVGLAENDPLILDRKTWKGKNWLGEVLTEVRENIIKSMSDAF